MEQQERDGGVSEVCRDGMSMMNRQKKEVFRKWIQEDLLL